MVCLMVCNLRGSGAVAVCDHDLDSAKPALRRVKARPHHSDGRTTEAEGAEDVVSIASRLHTARRNIPEMCNTLVAGQQYSAGVVCVWSKGDQLCITYNTTGGDWEMDAYHLWVGTDLSDMPSTPQGSPKLGQFPYTGTGLTHPNRTILTVCVPLDDLGNDDLCKLNSTVYVVAHANLELVIDGNVTQTETGYGDGFDLGGSSWATGMNVSLCEVFDAAGLDADLANLTGSDGTATIQVQHQGGSPSAPYFKGTITYNDEGDNITGLDIYCVDLANTIVSGRLYCALLLSSYSPNVTRLQSPMNEADWAQVNYILNTYEIGDALNGVGITGGDIQRAIWNLTTGELPPPFAFLSGPSNTTTVNAMLTAAASNGVDYVPPCDGKVGVILYPVADADCGSGAIPPGGSVAQALVAQAQVTTFDAACQCAVCSIEPPPADA